MPSAARPTASIISRTYPPLPVSSGASSGSSTRSASRLKISACAAALRPHWDLPARPQGRSTLSCNSVRWTMVIRAQARRAAIACAWIIPSSISLRRPPQTGLAYAAQYLVSMTRAQRAAADG